MQPVDEMSSMSSSDQPLNLPQQPQPPSQQQLQSQPVLTSAPPAPIRGSLTPRQLSISTPPLRAQPVQVTVGAHAHVQPLQQQQTTVPFQQQLQPQPFALPPSPAGVTVTQVVPHVAMHQSAPTSGPHIVTVPAPVVPAAAGATMIATAPAPLPLTAPNSATTTVNLFVAGLLPTTTEDDLRALFSPFGEIQSTKLMLDTRTGASRGFGFVLFKDYGCGVRAMDILNGQKFGSSRLHISVSQHDGQIGESTQLYIRNIPLAASDESVREYFAQYGEITQFMLRPSNTPAQQQPSQHHGSPQQQQQLQSQQSGSGGSANDSFGNAPPYHHQHATFGVAPISESAADLSAGDGTQHLTIQYESVEQAKKALTGCHGSTPFPPFKAPLLAKFSESTYTRLSRRALRDRHKQVPVTQANPAGAMSILTTAAAPPPQFVQHVVHAGVPGMPAYGAPPQQVVVHHHHGPPPPHFAAHQHHHQQQHHHVIMHHAQPPPGSVVYVQHTQQQPHHQHQHQHHQQQVVYMMQAPPSQPQHPQQQPHQMIIQHHQHHQAAIPMQAPPMYHQHQAVSAHHHQQSHQQSHQQQFFVAQGPPGGQVFTGAAPPVGQVLQQQYFHPQQQQQQMPTRAYWTQQ